MIKAKNQEGHLEDCLCALGTATSTGTFGVDSRAKVTVIAWDTACDCPRTRGRWQSKFVLMSLLGYTIAKTKVALVQKHLSSVPA